MELRCPICKAKLFNNGDDSASCLCGFRFNESERKGYLEDSPLSVSNHAACHALLRLINFYKPDFVVSNRVVTSISFALSDVTFVYKTAKIEVPGVNVICLKNDYPKDFKFKYLVCVNGLWAPNFVNIVSAIIRTRPDTKLQIPSLTQMDLERWLFLMCLLTSEAHKGFSWAEYTLALRWGVPCAFNIQQGYSSELIISECGDEALAFNYQFGSICQYNDKPITKDPTDLYNRLDSNAKEVLEVLDNYEEIIGKHVSEVFDTNDVNIPIVRDTISLYLDTKNSKVANDIYGLIDVGCPGGIDLRWKHFFLENPCKTSLRYFRNYMRFITDMRLVAHRDYPDYDYGKEYMIANCYNKPVDNSSKEVVRAYYEQFDFE